MTNTYKKVYIKDTGTVGGIYEGNGPLKKYFDKVYDKDFYFMFYILYFLLYFLF